MIPKSPLDNPETAAFAWARYKRLMRFMMMVTIGVVLIALALLYDGESSVSVHFYIATALGIGFMMLLTSALMGLVFLSSGTGHDESVTDLTDDDTWDRDKTED
ncbi:hypothetical protein GCM10023115_04690 [Pontixanthobacter gangjinensis]|uniref:Uncharacterized protein n=1 Tax=Pontixanthobacter gangjinensis TaxID=1028742 RepID=A0A6I4SLR6_9SPHN|nr:hypothetical protein [Pontixanthobacter gangjinensis]MXO55722.1 hypothetical protein [Pontixanthobacter gangjinensis]